MGCGKSQEFLANRDVAIGEQVSANKTKFARDAALELARAAARVVVAKGKRVVEFDMEHDPPDEQTLLKAMLGPTGNLRAPTVRRGKTLIVGFNAEAYAEYLA